MRRDRLVGGVAVALWEFSDGRFEPVPTTDFRSEFILERQDLQRVLRDRIEAIDDGLLVIGEEFSDWEDARLRIDLLCLDRDANLVVIELKRTDSGGESELQAIRYAAMASTMTFQQAVGAYRSFLSRRGEDPEPAEERILAFLGWETADDGEFASDVRVILCAADFSRPLTSAVLWLRERNIDIRCVRMRPHRLADARNRIIVDIQQVIPLPEATEYQVRVANKVQEQRERRADARERKKFLLTVNGRRYENLGKRALLYYLVRALVDEAGVHPDELAERIRAADPRKRSQSRGVWLALEGVREADEMLAAALEKDAGHKRYFTNQDELVIVDGRTYAFTNQWGASAEDVADALIAAYPQLRASYTLTDALEPDIV